MAKIYRVIQIKLNQLVYEMCTWSMTYQQSVFKRYHSDRHLSEFLPTRWREKSTGIDMEQNYATVTLCITAMWHRSHGMWRAGSMKLSGVRLSVCPSIRPIIRSPHAAAAGLLLWARRPGDIDRLLHDRRSAANASSVTSSADAAS